MELRGARGEPRWNKKKGSTPYDLLPYGAGTAGPSGIEKKIPRGKHFTRQALVPSPGATPVPSDGATGRAGQAANAESIGLLFSPKRFTGEKPSAPLCGTGIFLKIWKRLPSTSRHRLSRPTHPPFDQSCLDWQAGWPQPNAGRARPAPDFPQVLCLFCWFLCRNLNTHAYCDILYKISK